MNTQLKSILNVALIATILITTPSQAAEEWKTLSPSDCSANLKFAPGNVRLKRDYTVEANGDISNTGSLGSTRTRFLVVTCNIPRTTIDDNVLKVYINHVNGASINSAGPTSAGDTMVCKLTASAFNNPAMINSTFIFADTLGFHSSYGEVLTFGWGSAVVQCEFPQGSNIDNNATAILKTISYK